MRIVGWHVDGFGLLADYGVENLPPGLTVVQGPNEAGKTTMLAFIRGVLFGFPDGRSSDRRYPPLRGGQMGGRLMLEAEDGPWVVERAGAPSRLTVTLPGGDLGSKEDLSRLLGGADKELFRNIFAFSLKELGELDALEGGAVRERIFASPLIGAARSPGEAIRLLDQLRAKLLKPRAGAEINDLRRALRETGRDTHEAQRIAETYPRAVHDEEEAAKEVERLSGASTEIQATVARYERLTAAWQDWSERSSARAELEQILVPEGVTEDAGERLEQVLADVREVRRALNERQDELSGHKTRLERVSVDDRLPPISAEARALFAHVSAYEADLRRISEMEGTRETEGSRLAGELSVLGPGWDRERVAKLDVSIPTADEVRSWGDKIKQAAELEARLSSAIENGRRQSSGLADERAGLEEELEGCADVPNAQDLDQAERQARRLSALLAERAQTETKVEYATQALEDRRIALPRVPGPSIGAGPTRAVLLGVAALLGLSAVAMTLVSQWVAAGVLAVAAVAVLATGLRPGSARGTGASAASGPAVGEERLRDAATSLEDRKAQLEGFDGQIAEVAASLNLPLAPSALDAQEKLGAIARQREARARVDELSRRVEAVLIKAREAADRLVGLERELDSARADSSKTRGEWDEWRARKGIPESLAPELVTDLFTSVHRCRESLGRLNVADRELGELRSQVKGFEEAAGRVLDAADMDRRLSGSALAAALGTLHDKAIEDEGARKDRRGLATAIAGTERHVAEAEAELQDAEAIRAAILAEAGAADEAELRESVSRLVRRAQLEEQVAGCDKRVEAQLGKGPTADELRAELSTGDLSTWEVRRQEAAEQAREVQARRDEALRRHQDARQETARIGQSSDVAGLEIQAEGLRQQISDAIARWQTATLARSLIEATLSRFEKEHQPKVVARASALFREVTSGHYENLIARDGALEVIDDRAARIDVGDLSTGTAQQLYLCMRFGLAEEFAERGTSLPLIMDEVLVNFDPERAQAVARAIADVSTRHQVLLFTCHPGTVSAMQEASPSARVIELVRYGSAPTQTANAPRSASG